MGIQKKSHEYTAISCTFKFCSQNHARVTWLVPSKFITDDLNPQVLWTYTGWAIHFLSGVTPVLSLFLSVYQPSQVVFFHRGPHYSLLIQSYSLLQNTANFPLNLNEKLTDFLSGLNLIEMANSLHKKYLVK